MAATTAFHGGELQVQERAGVRGEAARLAGMMEPTELSGGVSRFLAGQSLALLTARDGAGVLWVSPVLGAPGFLLAQGSELRVRARPAGVDPLAEVAAGQPVGMLVIDLAARRRVRVNGTLTAVDGDGFTVAVEQAYGNCPQYIHPRNLPPPATAGGADPAPVRRSQTLDADQARRIAAADTFFLGTVHPHRGADASHRGGPVGFVHVSGCDLSWPDYPGNNMFNSFGNLAVDPSAALLFPDFTTGAVLYLSGQATVEWSAPDAGTGRRAHFTPTHIVDTTQPGAGVGSG